MSNELRFWLALKEIASAYDVEYLRRNSEKKYGLAASEAIEFAHDNLRFAAKNALKGTRRPKA